MKREVCPNCGGVLVAESIGWKCKSCRGFISLKDGKFYEYVEKPFMPPQTNADRIRAMSDEELGRFLAAVENRRSAAGGGAIWKGAAHAIDWLKQPVKDGEDE